MSDADPDDPGFDRDPEPIELTSFELSTILAEEPVMIDGTYLVQLSEAQIEDMLLAGGVHITCPLTHVPLLISPPDIDEAMT